MALKHVANFFSFTTYFNAAYCIMLIPSQIILTYVRPSFWLPGLEIAWGVLTGLIAMCNSAKQIYVLRVFLGLCESSAWPGMMTLFSRSSQFPRFLISTSCNYKPRPTGYSVLVHPNRASETHGILSIVSGGGTDDVRCFTNRHHQHHGGTSWPSGLAVAVRYQRHYHSGVGTFRVLHDS